MASDITETTATEKTGRRLAAILHADIAGYSRLMGNDEAGTHSRLKSHHNLVQQNIRNHGGRIVGTAGDAILAEFASVSEALGAAMDSQRTMAAENAQLPDEEKFQYRMGINLGEVIFDGGDIFGDGVNVAARIQAMAEPGGVAISANVYEHVRNVAKYRFDDLGNHSAKNISTQIHVYAVHETTGGQPVRRVFATSRFLKPALAVVAICGIALAALVYSGAGPWPQIPDHQLTRQEPAGKLQEQEKPTIAVLPFTHRGGDETQAYFSDGLTEDVIIDLGRFSELLVLAFNAVAPYKGKNVPPAQLFTELGADYIVSGTVQRSENLLRVAVHLTNARNGVQLWAERYTGSPAEVFSFQAEISRKVVAALSVNLSQAEYDRILAKPTGSLNAYEHVLQARALLRQARRDANFDARTMIEQAIASDPQYADAYAELAWTHLNDYKFGWSEWPQRSIDRAQMLARKAISIDERNASAHAALADILRFRKEYELAETEILRAIELNPNSSTSQAIHGSILVWSGRTAAAIEPLELALRINPKPDSFWVASLALAYYFAGRYEDAVHLAERYEGFYEEDPAVYAVLVAANGKLGEKTAALKWQRKLESISPFFNLDIFAGQFSGERDPEHLIEGFRMAQ